VDYKRAVAGATAVGESFACGTLFLCLWCLNRNNRMSGCGAVFLKKHIILRFDPKDIVKTPNRRSFFCLFEMDFLRYSDFEYLYPRKQLKISQILLYKGI